MKNKKAYHGGAFFEAIGEDFTTLEKSKDVIAADVLDAWFDPAPNISKKIGEHLKYMIRTPPPTHASGLIKTISEIRKVPRENILVGGGSSDLMFILFPQLLQKDDSVLILDPMYGEYAHIMEHVLEVKLHRHMLSKENNFNIDFEALLKDVKKHKPNVIILVNPNSPTGVYSMKKEILEFIKQVSPETKVVIDETYIDYVSKDQSLEKEAANYKNIIIIKSMSKVYALSGARVAYLVANAELARDLSVLIPPWAVSFVGQVAGVEALKNEEYYAEMYEKTHELREQLSEKLKKIGAIKVYDSVANFILIEIIDGRFDAEDVVQKMRKQSIFIRNCDSMGKQFSNNFLRIAVKDSKTNEKIMKCLFEVFE